MNQHYAVPVNELIAETIVSKISALINREVIFTDPSGMVLSSTDLSKTGLHYSIMQRAAESRQNLAISQDDSSFAKNPLANGIAIPLTYNGEIVAVMYVQDD